MQIQTHRLKVLPGVRGCAVKPPPPAIVLSLRPVASRELAHGCETFTALHFRSSVPQTTASLKAFGSTAGFATQAVASTLWILS
jgi:hypothetical protein